MGFRMRKSFRVAKGVRINVSKSGIGTSVGAKGVRYSAHSSGRRTSTIGIPGSGVAYVSTKYSGNRNSPARPSQTAANNPTSAALKKPGLFAPKGEKLVYKAVRNSLDVSILDEAASTEPDYRNLALTFAGLKRATTNQETAAIPQLQEVFVNGYEPSNDKFIQTYLSVSSMSVGIAPGVVAQMPINRDLIGLTLAELLQRSNDLNGAIAIVEQLEPSTYAAVSLAELYNQTNRPDEVIKLTDGLTNEDEASTVLLIFRGMALAKKNYVDAAQQAFKEALRFRSRPVEMRHLALFERAKLLIGVGKPGLAKKDLEKILAENAEYPGLTAMLQKVG